MREQCESYFARALNFHGVVSSTPTLFCMKVAYLHSIARFFPPRPCKMCYCKNILCNIWTAVSVAFLYCTRLQQG